MKLFWLVKGWDKEYFDDDEKIKFLSIGNIREDLITWLYSDMENEAINYWDEYHHEFEYKRD